MENLRLSAVSLFLIIELAFDQFSPAIVDPEALNIAYTNWMVAYYSVLYAVFALICLEGSIMSISKVRKWIFTFFGLIFFSFALIDLSFRNTPLIEYTTALNERLVSHWVLVLLILFLGILSFWLWQRKIS